MPRHCSACGGWIGTQAPVACATCGTRHWLNAKPAGAALVVADGRLLLTRRAIEPWRGLWCAPSGFCDGDEHPAACAEREAQEEAGGSACGSSATWATGSTSTCPAARGRRSGVLRRLYFHAVPEDAADTRADTEEVAELGWFAPDSLPAGVSPPGNGPRIYTAWREAFETGRLHTALPDAPF